MFDQQNTTQKKTYDTRVSIRTNFCWRDETIFILVFSYVSQKNYSDILSSNRESCTYAVLKHEYVTDGYCCLSTLHSKRNGEKNMRSIVEMEALRIVRISCNIILEYMKSSVN